MQKKKFTIGVDVSKNTLDIHCAELNQHTKITNDLEGFKCFLKFCKCYQISISDTFVVMEYTRGYEFRFIQFLESKAIAYVRIPGLAIKKSMGIVRGKTDKIDAFRIAQFGEEKYKQLEPAKPINKSIVALKNLLTFRKGLVRNLATYKGSTKERKHMYEISNADIIIKSSNKLIKQLEAEIEVLNEAILNVIKADQALLANYVLVTSIKGIGFVNAAMTIAYTENFTCFKDARAYAVYVGVVPFEYSSGTSINGRRRVSPIANKELKQELCQAARSALQWDMEMKIYGARLKDKKHYLIILNNIKFKLILRMFSVVKKGELYVDRYKISA